MSSGSLFKAPVKKAVSTIVFAALTLSLAACGSGSGKNIKIEGIKGPKVAVFDNKMTMWVTFENITIDVGARVAIPKAPNSFIEFGPDLQSNGSIISIGLDLSDIRALTGNGFNLLDPLTLPGGRPLPGISEGYLPGIGVQIPQWHNIAFYFGTRVFGVFVPVKMGIPNLLATYRFYSDSGTRIGNISLVGQDEQKKNSGFLLLVDLQGLVGQMVARAPL